jgi:hypothetical protein
MKSNSVELAYKIVSILNEVDEIQADTAISIAQAILAERYLTARKAEIEAISV